MDFDKLYLKAKNGDKNSEKELLSYLFVRFSIIAKRKVQSSDVEDIAQEACLTIVEKYKSLDDSTEFIPWAFKILRNKIGNHLQKKGTQKGKLADLENLNLIPDYSNTDPELKMKIENCLKKLFKENRRYYEIICLSKDGYKTDEICDKYKIKPGYLYVILDRCRSKLMKCLGLEE